MEQFECSIDLGYLTNAPIWENHRRGTNYAAVIGRDPKSPGGLSRIFLDKGKGEDFYYGIENLSVGSAIEFAADYTSGGGNKSRRRRYGIVRKLSDGVFKCDLYETPTEVFSILKQEASERT